MSELIRNRMLEGIWEGEFSGFVTEPEIDIFHREEALSDITVAPGDDGTWRVKVPIPSSVLSDGTHSFLVQTKDGTTIATFNIIAGNAVADDIRSEIGLLRAELDMLKKAFRRHCLETMD